MILERCGSTSRPTPRTGRDHPAICIYTTVEMVPEPSLLLADVSGLLRQFRDLLFQRFDLAGESFKFPLVLVAEFAARLGARRCLGCGF